MADNPKKAPRPEWLDDPNHPFSKGPTSKYILRLEQENRKPVETLKPLVEHLYPNFNTGMLEVPFEIGEALMANLSSNSGGNPVQLSALEIAERQIAKLREENRKLKGDQLTVKLFGMFLDLAGMRFREGMKVGQIIGAWDEAREPGCYGGKYISKEVGDKARAALAEVEG